MKKKTELELFSPMDEGELVPLSKYLKEMLEYCKVEWPAVNWNQEQINKVWSKIVKNEYLPDNVPDEFVELYERMSADKDMAAELLLDKEEATPKEPKAKEMEVVSAESAESLALVESVKDGIELGSFTSKFDMGAGFTQCRPRGEVTMKDWVGAFAFGLTLESGAQWIIGDAVVALENAGHDDVVNQLCAQFKKSYPTVSGYARACRAFPHETRDAKLPFSVYREIGNASFGDETGKKQLALLDKAKEESWNSSEVRSHVRMEQGKGDAPAPVRYMRINLSNQRESKAFREMPDIEETDLLIDLSGKKIYDAGNEEWIQIEVEK